jgi:hypothetical protein
VHTRMRCRPTGLVVEHVVEGDDAGDPGDRQVEEVRHRRDRLRGQPAAVRVLGQVERGEE